MRMRRSRLQKSRVIAAIAGGIAEAAAGLRASPNAAISGDRPYLDVTRICAWANTPHARGYDGRTLPVAD